MASDTNLVTALQHTAAQPSGERGIRFYSSIDSSEFRSYRDLDLRARSIAHALTDAGFAPAEQAVLAIGSGLEWADAAYGLLYAGMAVVPTPAMPAGLVPRLAGTVRAAAASVVITDRAVRALIGDAADELGVPVLCVEDLVQAGDAAMWVPPVIDANATALLMFTSGSTGDPKGVIATHGSLAAIVRNGSIAMDVQDDTSMVGWMPLHHAMGLGLQIIFPASAGIDSVLTSTEQFQRRPIFWLQMISMHRATMSFAGNFAFGICTQLATDAQVADLDLSSLKMLISGSEPVRPETVDAFVARFAPAGLAPSTITPGFGMTEAMLLAMKPVGDPYVARTVDAAELGAGRLLPSTGDGTIELVSCGRPLPEATIRVVDPETLHAVPDGGVGEIWVASPTVSPGYFRRPDATAETFGYHLPGDDRSYMRTGDLAGILDGELFITGRLKEVIIIRGRNLYPADIEATAAAVVPGLAVAAAFELDGPRPGVGLVIEVDEEARAQDGRSLDEVLAQVREAVTERFSLPFVAVALTPLGGVPRTPTGKIRRGPARAAVVSGQLPILLSTDFTHA